MDYDLLYKAAQDWLKNQDCSCEHDPDSQCWYQMDEDEKIINAYIAGYNQAVYGGDLE